MVEKCSRIRNVEMVYISLSESTKFFWNRCSTLPVSSDDISALSNNVNVKNFTVCTTLIILDIESTRVGINKIKTVNIDKKEKEREKKKLRKSGF